MSVWLAAVLLTLTSMAAAQDAQAPEEIIVVGRLSGPGMWKVSNGDNALWIFGVFSPIPVHMEWDSARVKEVMTEADEYLATPGWRVARGALLTPQLYRRFAALKHRYFPNDSDIEQLRPLYALQSMRNWGLQQAGLTMSISITNELDKLAKNNRKLHMMSFATRCLP